MKKLVVFTVSVVFITNIFLVFAEVVQAQVLKTPLKQEVLDILTNEISGQMIFNNQVLLSGAPWVRSPEEFTGTFYESQKIYDIAKSYGFGTVRFDTYPSQGSFDYPLEGEFWIIKPESRLVARIGADAALVARGSRSVDITADLVYIPPLTREMTDQMIQAGPLEKYKGKIALMWSHASGNTAQALDAAGIKGVISFSSRERFFDPNQVIYGSGSYNQYPNLSFGFSVSWRQWSELLEDLEAGRAITVRCKTRIETYQDRFEDVYCWIPGTEPDKKGVVFTAHLFEGYLKRGANDNMSGCVIQLEIYRVLNKLIADGILPKPRRSIHFIWPNEISGTYEFFKNNIELIDKWSVNITMDMCGEGLRINNSWFTMSECPSYLPSYLDGLAASLLNYVWRTNDIVYTSDSPRGRPGGQYFPKPMVEKNGSSDAFRFFIHSATGGSDHTCFNNYAVGVPAIEFFVWPDNWYHADTDTPDKGDPTQMKRIAFIGAAAAYAAANCTDDVADRLAEAASNFGYSRIAERELPKALNYIELADAAGLQTAAEKALTLIIFAADREKAAVASIEEIYTGSPAAQVSVNSRKQQWELYKTALKTQALSFAAYRAQMLKTAAPKEPKITDVEKKYSSVVPSVSPAVKGKVTSLNGFQPYSDYIRQNPDAVRNTGLSAVHLRVILNYINGKNSITDIKNAISAETGEFAPIEAVVKYIELLKTVKWVEY